MEAPLPAALRRAVMTHSSARGCTVPRPSTLSALVSGPSALARTQGLAENVRHVIGCNSKLEGSKCITGGAHRMQVLYRYSYVAPSLLRPDTVPSIGTCNCWMPWRAISTQPCHERRQRRVPHHLPAAAEQRIVHLPLAVEPGMYCSPRHPAYVGPSFLGTTAL